MNDSYLNDSNLIEIELIDADPTAFGPAEQPPRPPRQRRARPRPAWLAPLAFGLVAALVAGAAFVAWRPWDGRWTVTPTFPTGEELTPTLTEQLVLDEPPSDLSAASLGVLPAGDESRLGNLDGAVGYFFGAPGATFGFGQANTGRWAAFFAISASSPNAPLVDGGGGATAVTVQGAPGRLLTSVGNRTIEVTFGPVAGMIYSVVTSELSQAEALAFADTAAVDGDTASMRDAAALGDMRPIGSMTDFVAAWGLVIGASDPTSVLPGVVSAQYGPEGGRMGVTSRSATTKIVPMLRFLLGVSDDDARVHDLPALVLPMDAGDPLSGPDTLGTIVAWVEGDRLVLVSGPHDVDAITALAESVRPATDEEWTEVQRVAGNTATTAAD